VRYEPATKTKPTAIGCQSGTAALLEGIRQVWPELVSGKLGYGCWNPRHIAGSQAWSLHAEGRAIDTGVPAAQKELAWLLACDLVTYRIALGTMRVIWDGHIWSTEKPANWRPLNPSLNQHHDHIHSEQFWTDARRSTAVAVPLYVSTLRAGRAKHVIGE